MSDRYIDSVAEAVHQLSIRDIPEGCELSASDIEIIAKAAASLPKKNDEHRRDYFKRAIDQMGSPGR